MSPFFPHCSSIYSYPPTHPPTDTYQCCTLCQPTPLRRLGRGSGAQGREKTTLFHEVPAIVEKERGRREKVERSGGGARDIHTLIHTHTHTHTHPESSIELQDLNDRIHNALRRGYVVSIADNLLSSLTVLATLAIASRGVERRSSASVPSMTALSEHLRRVSCEVGHIGYE
jgi:hypothetical protein